MIVVCGEALMDVFANGETPSGVALDARGGGSPFNVAVGLARLEQTVAFFGAVSTGFLGERLIRALASEGVETRSTRRVDAPTTLGLVGLDERGAASYAFYGHGGADRALDLDALDLLPASIDVVHLGSYALVVEPAATTLRAVVERERGRALISYDPNLRLGVEPDIRRWREAVAWLLPRVDLLKISDEDLSRLAPGMDVRGFAQDALERGAALVVVTRGDAGADAFTAGASASVGAEPTTLVDTVGAGDSFQAALLSWLVDRRVTTRAALGALSASGLEEALRWASRAAAITCSRRGADLPRRAELSGR